MTSIDLSPVLTPLLQGVGVIMTAVVGIVGTWVLTKLGTKLGIQASGAAMANLDAAAGKVIQTAVMATQAEIKAKGYDHISVQNEQIAIGAQTLIDKFPGTLKDSGIDPSTPEGAAAVTELVTRALPAGVAAAAASPTTPPVPDDQKPTVQSLLVPVAAVKGAL